MSYFYGALVSGYAANPEALAPTSSVPNVSIQRDPGITGFVDHDVTWSAAGSAPENTYNVRVDWFVNSVLDATDSVDESNEIVTRSYDIADDIEADVYYVNSGGAGPVTSVGPI